MHFLDLQQLDRWLNSCFFFYLGCNFFSLLVACLSLGSACCLLACLFLCSHLCSPSLLFVCIMASMAVEFFYLLALVYGTSLPAWITSRFYWPICWSTRMPVYSLLLVRLLPRSSVHICWPICLLHCPFNSMLVYFIACLFRFYSPICWFVCLLGPPLFLTCMLALNVRWIVSFLPPCMPIVYSSSFITDLLVYFL